MKEKRKTEKYEIEMSNNEQKFKYKFSIIFFSLYFLDSLLILFVSFFYLFL